MRKLQNTSNYQTCCYQDYHQDLSRSVYLNGFFHVFCGEGTVVRANIGFIEEFSEIIVWPTEAAVQDSRQGRFRIAAVGRSMVTTVGADEGEKREATSNQRASALHVKREQPRKDHQQRRQARRDIVGHIVDTSRPTAEVLIALCPVANH